MAGKIRRFKGGYTSLWQKISESLPIEVHCITDVLAVRRNSDSVSVDVKRNNGEFQEMQFDKIIISGSFPFRNGNTYRSPAEKSAGFLTFIPIDFQLFSTSLVSGNG